MTIMKTKEAILKKLESELIPGLGPSSSYYEFGYNEGIKSAIRIIKEGLLNDSRESSGNS